MSNPLQLAIDTSSARASVAVYVDASKVCHESAAASPEHNEALCELVQLTLKAAGADVSGISEIILGAGPGSFTGLRIGYAFVQGLAQSQDLPVKVVSSFQGIASLVSQDVSQFGVVASAGRGVCFYARYARKQGPLAQISEPEVVNIESIVDEGARGLLFSADTIAGLQCSKVTQIASGLLNAEINAKSAPLRGAIALAGLVPNYVRAVSAKMISER